MGIVFRQSIKTSIVIASGAVLGAVFNYAGAFVLTKQEFGFLTNFIYIAALFQIIILVGTSSLLSTYTQKFDADDPRRKGLITFSLLLTIATSIILFTVYFLFKDNIVGFYKLQDQEYINRYYVWLPFLVFVWGITSLFEMLLIVHSKVAVISFVREVVLRIFNLVIIGLFYFKVISFHQFMISSILVYIIPAITILLIASRFKGFGLTFNFKVFNKAEYTDLLKFSWYHMLLNISLNFLGYIDTIMLAPLDKSGMESLAAYRWAVMVIGIMTIPYRAMRTSSFSTLNQTYIDKNYPKLYDIFHRSGINVLIVAVSMFLLIAFNIDNLIKILPEGYESLKPVVLILMLGQLVDMASGLNTELISISEYYKFNFRISFVLLLMIVSLDRLLIPLYGVYGAAWGTTISLILFNAAKMIYLWKKMKVQPFTPKSITVIFAGLITAVIMYVIPDVPNAYLDSIIKAAIIFSIYFFLLIKFKSSNDLNGYVESIWKNKRLF
jgi:O-antigen/teichoic acid export membrane protein